MALLQEGASVDRTHAAQEESACYPKVRSKRDMRALRRYIRLFSAPYAIRAYGTENIPKEGGYLVCSNHTNNLDPFWLLSAAGERIDRSRMVCFAAKERMEHRAERRLFNLLGAIPVDPSGNTVPAMKRAKECLLQEDKLLLIFPEGARSRDGSMLPFKNGAAQLALETQRAILPVCLDGAYEVFPRSRALPRLFRWRSFRRYEIRVTFCPPVAPEGSIDAITQKVRAEIAAAKDASQPALNDRTAVRR